MRSETQPYSTVIAIRLCRTAHAIFSHLFGKRGKSVTTYAMLDSGSEITLVDSSLMSSLDLKGQPDELVVSTVSNDNDIQQGCRIDVSVESLVDDEPQRLVLKNAWCGRALKIPLRHQLVLNNKSRWPHIQDITFPDVEEKKISIIIGTNVPEAFIPLMFGKMDLELR